LRLPLALEEILIALVEKERKKGSKALCKDYSLKASQDQQCLKTQGQNIPQELLFPLLKLYR